MLNSQTLPSRQRTMSVPGRHAGETVPRVTSRGGSHPTVHWRCAVAHGKLSGAAEFLTSHSLPSTASSLSRRCAVGWLWSTVSTGWQTWPVEGLMHRDDRQARCSTRPR